MPELPEVERVRLSLSPIIGRTVEAVDVRRADVITLDASSTAGDHGKPVDSRSTEVNGMARALLLGRRIVALERLGKQLAIVAGDESHDADPGRLRDASRDSGNSRKTPRVNGSHRPSATPCVCVHLGMTGSLILHRRAIAHDQVAHDQATADHLPPHTHIVWRLSGGDGDATGHGGGGATGGTTGGGELHFRDPRRFGGVWSFASVADLLDRRWRLLGPDALTIQPRRLHAALIRTRRAIKAALLDQHVVAGLGNIYVDEALFRCRLHPLTPADGLSLATVQRLVAAMRRMLRAAIAAGGSSLRDYVDGNGDTGGYQHRHQVYGRAARPCRRCGDDLAGNVIAGRATVWCPICQADPL